MVTATLPCDDWLPQLLASLNASDEVCKVGIGHRVAPDQVGRCSLVPDLELARHLALQVIDLVAIPIENDRTCRAHDGCATVASVVLHPVAAFALPGDHRIVIGEAGAHGVVELPVILELVSSSDRGDTLRVIDPHRPAADVDLVRSIV